MLAGFRRSDPIPTPKLAVPVEVVEKVAEWGSDSAATEKEKAVGGFNANSILLPPESW